MGVFSDQLIKNIENALLKTNTEINSIAKDAFETTVKVSPAQPSAYSAKGEFINNWFPMVNGYDPSTSILRSMTGVNSLTRIDTTMADSKAFYRRDGYITLTNNLPYAYRVEVLGWPLPKWSGTIGPYAPVRTAATYMLGKYSP